MAGWAIDDKLVHMSCESEQQGSRWHRLDRVKLGKRSHGSPWVQIAQRAETANETSKNQAP